MTERGVNVFDWLGNSADLSPIEEVWNIMKKKSGMLPNNKKKTFGITFVTYGMVCIEKLLRNCMMKCLHSMVEAVRKAKGGSTMYLVVENDGVFKKLRMTK